MANLLAPFLVKISALAGVAVPLHRFAYPEESSDGINVTQLEPANAAMELWKIRFPDGVASIIHPDQITKSSLPILWVNGNAEDLDLRIIRGIQNDGFLAESSDSQTDFLPLETITEGTAIQLITGELDRLLEEQFEYSAKDWFYKAILRRRRVFFEAVFATLMLSIFGLMSAYTQCRFTTALFRRMVLALSGYSQLEFYWPFYLSF